MDPGENMASVAEVNTVTAFSLVLLILKRNIWKSDTQAHLLIFLFKSSKKTSTDLQAETDMNGLTLIKTHQTS